MFTSSAGLLVVLWAFLPICCFKDGPQGESVWRLKREVEERERQFTRAQRELAEARARVALAEGKRDLAITELRKVVAGYQGEIQWIRDHANWFCDPREPMTAALWELAKTRVKVAEMEGDTAARVAEWKKIVGFHEEEMQRVRKLEQMKAIRPEEKTISQKALDNARERLAAAEKQMAAEQTKKQGTGRE